MTVYVDEFPEGWGKWTGGGHMLTTDLDELHEIAQKIGLKREWFQDKTFPHYDVQRRKRLLAIQHGAKQVAMMEIPDDVLMRKSDGTYETRGERVKRREAKARR